MSGSISSISGSGGASSALPDSEYSILCDDNGKFLRRYTRDAAGVLTIVDTQLDGSTVYIPVGAVTVCAASNSVTVSLVCGVVGGVSKPLIRRALVDSAGVETVTFLDVDGALVTPTTWTPGLCNNHLVSTIERLVGAGTITIPTNARSITVTVNAGTPTVQIGSSAAIGLVKNLSLTWGTDGSNEDLSDQFVFTGIAGSDFYVTTSRL